MGRFYKKSGPSYAILIVLYLLAQLQGGLCKLYVLFLAYYVYKLAHLFNRKVEIIWFTYVPCTIIIVMIVHNDLIFRH